MYEQNVKLTAPPDGALYLWFEPWAEGLAFPAGSEIELQARSESEGELQIEETAERTAVYAWPGSTLRALANGTEVISFDTPVPLGLTREMVAMVFGAAPSPTAEEKARVVAALPLSDPHGSKRPSPERLSRHAVEQPMPALKRLQWSIDIAAPAAKVYQVLVGPESYKEWTSAFGDGLYFEGSWQKGERIRFLTSDGHGVISEIAENRPNEFLSIRHLGYIADDGVEDTSSEAIRSWTPAYENYTFTAIPQGTKLTVDQDMTEDFETMPEAWPEALAKLKALCENRA